MANLLKNIQGRATIAGTAIYTVPAGATLTIIGLRASNNDNTTNHWFHVDINGYLITGVETPLPIGSALDAVAGAKIVASAGDVITAFSDTNDQVDITISYLEQT